MSQITADDIRVLARSPEPEAVLVLRSGQPVVLPDAEAGGERAIYTKRRLVDEYGDEITDIEAEVLAANLTALTAQGAPLSGDAP